MAEQQAADDRLERQIEKVNSRAEKQLTMLIQMRKPLKDIGYHEFLKLVRRQAEQFKWPDHIAPDDFSATPNLTAEQRAQLDGDTVLGLTVLLHIRNANSFIQQCCDGHQVSFLLDGIEKANARASLDTIRQFFVPRTPAGLTAANQRFNNSTMANTKTNIIEWIAEVRINAQDLRDAGGDVSDAVQKSVLMAGLLQEFDMIRTIIDETDGVTLAIAIVRLTSFATGKGLLSLSKGKGLAPHGSSVFSADATAFVPKGGGKKKPGPCYAWANFKCRFGSKCRFNHDGPGALRSRNGAANVGADEKKDGDTAGGGQAPTGRSVSFLIDADKGSNDRRYMSQPPPRISAAERMPAPTSSEARDHAARVFFSQALPAKGLRDAEELRQVAFNEAAIPDEKKEESSPPPERQGVFSVEVQGNLVQDDPPQRCGVCMDFGHTRADCSLKVFAEDRGIEEPGGEDVLSMFVLLQLLGASIMVGIAGAFS